MSITKDDIVSAVRGANLESTLRENMQGWPGIDEAKVEQVVAWAKRYEDELIEHATEVDDPMEFPVSVAVAYIEFKSRWIALNTKMNYQLFRKGECDPVVQWQGTAVSALVGAVEPLLTHDDIQNISRFLATPLQQAA